MKRLIGLLATVIFAASMSRAAFVSADDRVNAARTVAFIGEQFEVSIEVEAPEGALVDIDPTAPSWAGVEVVRIVADVTTTGLGRSVHRIKILVAAFQVGELKVSPAVLVTRGVDVEQRVLPPLALNVQATLAPNAPLELSPLPPTRRIGGGESPWLRPAIWVGAGAALLIASFALFAVLKWVGDRLPRRVESLGDAPSPPDLGSAEALIANDPVRAYRTLGTVVRSELSRRYGFPAVALTTNELQRRMEAEGVERWQARLVSGLLHECDAVVYAGYRPAPERRLADLTTAREIVGADS